LVNVLDHPRAIWAPRLDVELHISLGPLDRVGKPTPKRIAYLCERGQNCTGDNCIISALGKGVLIGARHHDT
jgi:hypothetical protein